MQVALGALALGDGPSMTGRVWPGSGVSGIKGARGADAHPNYPAIPCSDSVFPLWLVFVALPLCTVARALLLRGSRGHPSMGDIQRAERLQFLASVADHPLERFVGGRKMIVMVHDGQCHTADASNMLRQRASLVRSVRFRASPPQGPPPWRFAVRSANARSSSAKPSRRRSCGGEAREATLRTQRRRAGLAEHVRGHRQVGIAVMDHDNSFLRAAKRSVPED